MPSAFLQQAAFKNRDLRHDRLRLSWHLGLIIALGFGAVAAFTYSNALHTSRRQAVESTLPLSIDALSADLEQAFVEPVQVASTMAANSLLIDWLASGEQAPEAILRYLRLVQSRSGATTTFFVSDRSGRYYHPSGVVKTIRPDSRQDSWYYRLRSNPGPYEVNLDRDTADLNRFTVFVNDRLEGPQGEFLGQHSDAFSYRHDGQEILMRSKRIPELSWILVAGAQPGRSPRDRPDGYRPLQTINDRFGHQVGDDVTRGVAEQIHSCVSPDDVSFRWGGKEYLPVLPGVDLASALTLGGRIGEAVSRVSPKTNPHTSDPPTVTVSIGVTEWRTDDGADAMLERADRALYRAKQSGRNRVVTG